MRPEEADNNMQTPYPSSHRPSERGSEIFIVLNSDREYLEEQHNGNDKYKHHWRYSVTGTIVNIEGMPKKVGHQNADGPDYVT